MKRFLILCSCLGLVASLVHCNGGSSLGTGKGSTLVTVNGKAITEGDIDFLGTINPRIKSQTATPFGQKQIVDNLVEQELLYQESTKRGLDHDPKVLARADLYRRVIVAQATIDDELEKSAKKYYDDHKEEFEKLELSHLVIRFKPTEGAEKGKKETVNRTEAQALALANQIKERLGKGEEFAKVAKEISEDAGSKGAGGMLGKVWKHEPRLERRGYGPLLEQAFTLKVGEIGGPTKSQEGYHLLTVTKGIEAQTFDDAKQSILFKLQAEIRTKLLGDLKQKAQIEYHGPLADQAKPSKPETTPPSPPAPTEPNEGGPAPKTPDPGERPAAPPATPTPSK